MRFAIKNRWLLVSLFLFATNAAVAALWWRSARSMPPTRVLRVTPEELPAAGSPLTVTFSRPMVAQEETGAIRPLSEIALRPPAPLLGVWRSRSTLELRPRQPLSLATPYQLTIPGRLVDAEGHPLKGDRVHRFQTPSLRVVQASQVALSRDWAVTLRVVFNDAVPLGDLDRAARFTDGTGAPVAMTRLTRGDAAAAVDFVSDRKRRERIEAAFDAGLRGVSGPLGLASNVRLVVDVESGLGLGEVSGSMNDANDGAIHLSLGMTVDPEAAKGFIRVEPEARYAVETAGGGLLLRGDFRAEAAYRVTVKAGLPAEGGRFLPDEAVRTVRMPELAPSLDLLGAGRFLAGEGTRSLLLRTVNLDAVLLGAERIHRNNLVHHLHGSEYVGSAVLEEKRIRIQGSRNQPVFTRIDLGEVLGEAGRGPFHLQARSADGAWHRAERTVAITDLGLHLKSSRKGFLAWVVRLSDLSPVAGARVSILSRENQELFSAFTDPHGVARWDGRAAEGKGEPFLATAESGDDLSYVPLEEGSLSVVGLDTGGRPYPESDWEAFVYPERGVIRPGESLHLRGIVRAVGIREVGGEVPPADMPLEWELARPDGRPAGKRPAELSGHGTAELSWASQPHHPTGRYTARLRLPDGGPVLGEASFRVEEFLPETLRVEVAAEDRRFAGGEEVPVRVRAEHLFGGPARGLEARARVELVPEPFVHPDWPGVDFQSSTGEYAGSTLEAEPAALDERGEAEFHFRIPAELRARSGLRAAITAGVLQVSGRASTARILRPVDPLPFYLGARQETGNARIREPWRVEAIALRPDGKTHPLARLDARVLRITWSHSLKKDLSSGVYRWTSGKSEALVASCEVPCSEGRGQHVFRPELGGEYRMVFTARRAPGETPVETSVGFFAEGGAGDEGGSLEVPGRIALIPDRPRYRAGETARVRVQSPITGVALLATETDRVHEARTFLLERADTTLEVEVGRDLLPHGYLTLTVVRAGPAPAGKGLPLRAYGAVPLPRDMEERAARVEMELPGEVRPGAELPLAITVRRPDGSPEDAEVAVALVDSGILALTGFQTPDPAGFFMAQRRLGTRAADLFSLIIPEPGELLGRDPAATGGDGDGGGYLNPISARRVRSVSLWLGGLKTDDEGRVVRSIPVPDFDGELVAMAVVAGKVSVGGAGRAVKSRRPVIIEPGLPRFLAPGDRFQAPVSIHNTTGEPALATVSVSPSGEVRLAEGAAREEARSVPAGGSAVVRFSLEAVNPGKAEVAFTCLALGEEVKKVTELPVRPASPPVSRFESLIVEAGKPAVFQSATDLLPGTERSELVLSTSILPTLEGSLHYLLRYPHGCLEQTSSSLIPWISIRDYLKAMGSGEYTDGEIRDRVTAGIERLLSMQTPEGGLGFWPGDHRAYPFGTIYAASVLLEARVAGHAVPGKPFARLLDYVETLLSNPREDDPRGRGDLRAQALVLLARAGRTQKGWMENLYERRDELGDEGRAHLALAAKLARTSLPGPVLEPEALTRKDREGERFPRQLAGSLYSRPRELCFALGALVELGTPRDKLLPIFTALAGMREGGRFRSTHEDGLFVFTVGKMAALFPRASGPVEVTVRVPGEEPRVVEVEGRRKVPLGSAPGPVELEAGPGGTVHASLETRGVPTGKAAEEDRDLSVRRRFLLPDGKPRPAGPFRQGEPVVVEISLDTPRALKNVAVVDPLPAGFEIENPALLTADGRAEADPRFGLARCEMRDDRLVLFAHPGPGQSAYRYAVRAVTAGNFALPPIAAECMYDGSIRSVHGAGTVQVERP